MSLELPKNFKEHIQHRDTQIFPVVVIGTHSQDSVTDESLTNYFNSAIHISTGTTSYNLGSLISDSPTVYTKPKLLNISSIKESIDMEKRNYKISSLNIEISNLEYQGSTFNDDIVASGMESLINKEVRIYWLSPTSNFIFPFDLDYSITDQDVLDRRALMVYYGKVVRFDQNEEKAKLVVEDRSQEALHADFPLEYVGSGDEILNRHQNKPKPMVFGYVEKSPLIPVDRYKTLIADSSPTAFAIEPVDVYGDIRSILFMNVGTHYINVHTHQFKVSENAQGLDLAINPLGVASEELKEISLTCSDYGEAIECTLSNVIHSNNLVSDDYDHPKGSLAKTIDGKFEYNPVDWQNAYAKYPTGSAINFSGAEPYSHVLLFYDNLKGQFSINFRDLVKLPNHGNNLAEFLLLSLNFAYLPQYDYKENSTPILRKMAVSSRHTTADVSFMLPTAGIHTAAAPNAVVLPSETITTDPFINAISGISETYKAFNKLADWSVDNNQRFLLYDAFNFTNATEGNEPNAAIQFDTTIDTDHPTDAIRVTLDFKRDGEYESDISEISLMTEVEATNIFNNEFFADVVGRGTTGSYGSYHTPLSSIVEHINNELNNGIITIPATAHTDWDYAFTVNKPINSKKLLQQLLSASPYMLNIDNTGRFNFVEIDYVGLFNDYFNNTLPNSIEINKNDVISSSFSRTKLEDAGFGSVEFHYNLDYSEDKFKNIMNISFQDISNETDASRVLNSTIEEYYGIKLDERKLVVNDDRGKYIRDARTAAKFAHWLLWHHCNQHLIVSLKLPLKHLNLTVGTRIKFPELISNTLPYGIDYSEFYMVNTQDALGDFTIISTNKNQKTIDIKAVANHRIPTLPSTFDFGGQSAFTADNFIFETSDGLMAGYEIQQESSVTVYSRTELLPDRMSYFMVEEEILGNDLLKILLTLNSLERVEPSGGSWVFSGTVIKTSPDYTYETSEGTQIRQNIVQGDYLLKTDEVYAATIDYTTDLTTGELEPLGLSYYTNAIKNVHTLDEGGGLPVLWQ